MKQLTFLFLLFLSSFILSQNSNLENSYIEVLGSSVKKVVPNEIYLDIFLKERIEKGKKLNLETLENQLKNALINIDISAENLFISDVNAVISKTGWFTKEMFSTAKYTLKVSSPKKLKSFFNCLDELKITQVNITKATHSKLTELKKENKIAAIKAAKEKAYYLLDAINEKLGKPVFIKETESNKNQNFANTSNLLLNGYTSGISKLKRNKTITQFEEIVLKTSIFIKFKIE
ncbi:SIMPL domain-containing protein [Polaribacter sp. KT 15]|uniref:SIMPL domain-containing protein n=1 Tax=Polaribacter sp. KT 15 TaxID=1896175 RepID=UPI00090C0888|nr:SIMPL domain-containing protein [Polaribacter sp. KT 15]SHM98239.1 hypothetical protein SAMN05720268_1837 [Polaribacter sp. KT 15]